MKRLALCISILCCMCFMMKTTVSASDATTYTYTISADGRWIKTVDGYLVSDIMYKDYDLKDPEDLFIKNGVLFVADTGNGRIVCTNLKTGVSQSLLEGELSSPTGIFVTDSGDMYIADTGKGAVMHFSADGSLIRSYTRPDTVIFGADASYRPQKVIVDDYGTLCIVSNGSYDGMIQISQKGEFLGYYGYNDAETSLMDKIRNLLFTQEQKASLFSVIPKTFNNLTVDADGIIYTTTAAAGHHAVKKHNLAGSNLIAVDMVDENNFVDLAIGKYNQIYAISSTGLIFEYENDSTLIHSFGGPALASERNGMITTASAIAVDDQDCLYVLDKAKGFVHVYIPTEMTETMHKAISGYQLGRYEDSLSLWEDVLRRSGNSRIAHQGIARCYYQLRNYESALMHYQIARDRPGYSEAFWEIRNDWITRYMSVILIGLAVCCVLSVMGRVLDRRKHIYAPLRKCRQAIGNVKTIKDFTYVKSFLYHPIDSFYYLRADQKGSTVGATLIYIVAYILFLLYNMASGFLIRKEGSSFGYLSVMFLLPILIWTVCNFMICEINDGRGRFRDVYRMTAYAMSPFVCFMPVLFLITHIITYNEMFIIQFGFLILIIWSLVLLYLGLQEIHEYTGKKAIQNIFLTLFCAFIAVFIFLVLFMLWERIADFVFVLGKEVWYRVIS